MTPEEIARAVQEICRENSIQTEVIGVMSQQILWPEIDDAEYIILIRVKGKNVFLQTINEISDKFKEKNGFWVTIQEGL